MEEVEQISTRIVIMDEGRNLAEGTSESLKQSIKMGETVQVETTALNNETIEALKAIPRVYEVMLEEDRLLVRSSAGGQTLLSFLEILQ